MECTLAALIACFSWGNLYVDTGIQIQDRGEIHHYYVDRSSEVIEADGDFTRSHYQDDSLIDWKLNPYGRFAIGYQLDFSNVTIRLEGIHTSSIARADDRGMNALGLSLRWFPFR